MRVSERATVAPVHGWGQDGLMNPDDVVLIANASDATISAFALRADKLLHLATTTLPGSSSAFAVDAERDLIYAFVKGEQPTIRTLRLHRASGTLTEVASAEVGAAMAYLSLAHGGTVLLGASYHGGVGTSWRVTDGTLSDPVGDLPHANLHCVVTSPDDNFAYFVSLGDDLIAQCALGDDGALTPLDPPTAAAPAGSGPRHLVLSADGLQAYCVTEFSGEVLRFSRDSGGRLTLAEAGSIVDPDAGLRHSRYGADPVAEHLIWGADVHLARDGRLLLATERSASTLATLNLYADGSLGEVIALRHTESQPRGFAVTPDGQRAVVVGERSTEASLYRIEERGEVVDLDRVETGNGANWVRILSGSPTAPTSTESD